jgi:L-lysine 6-transaminase
LLAIRSGDRSIRFRPVLDLPADAIESAMAILREQCRRMRKNVSPGQPKLDYATEMT